MGLTQKTTFDLFCNLIIFVFNFSVFFFIQFMIHANCKYCTQCSLVLCFVITVSNVNSSPTPNKQVHRQEESQIKQTQVLQSITFPTELGNLQHQRNPKFAPIGRRYVQDLHLAPIFKVETKTKIKTKSEHPQNHKLLISKTTTPDSEYPANRKHQQL